MKLFALGDLHLSLDRKFDIENASACHGYKPMAVFGDGWKDHTNRIYEHWCQVVGEDDLVLVPGDISWAMKLADTVFDFDFLHRLPGKKLLLRGNHDYWWHSPTKIRQLLPPSIAILQNDAYFVRDIAIAGTRLWTLPDAGDADSNDKKIFERELIRLELSLKAAKGRPTVVMFHYMPVNERCDRNAVTDLLQQYPVQTVVYGHLHDQSHRIAVEGDHFGMAFHLVSGDYLAFCPKCICEL